MGPAEGDPGRGGGRGNQDEAANDLSRVSALLSDAVVAGEGRLGESLRPIYIDYLARHPDA
ncbi:hypothetical protein [Thermocatellispora tengchongensis]|uniref:hypothetical protein n=1 Tax=Thermocatellispora tengchongensis TaxID=1073253 RepID=UPI00362544F1